MNNLIGGWVAERDVSLLKNGVIRKGETVRCEERLCGNRVLISGSHMVNKTIIPVKLLENTAVFRRLQRAAGGDL